MERMRTQPTHFTDDEKRELVELVASDVPLGALARQLIAGELYRAYFPDKVRDQQMTKRLQNWTLENWMGELQDRGMTAVEAAAAIVGGPVGKEMGIKTIEALQRRLRPSRK
jgi:hypothetical protein